MSKRNEVLTAMISLKRAKARRQTGPARPRPPNVEVFTGFASTIPPIVRILARPPEVQFSSWASASKTPAATRLSRRQAGALGMQHRLGVTIAALVAAALVHVSSAAMARVRATP